MRIFEVKPATYSSTFIECVLTRATPIAFIKALVYTLVCSALRRALFSVGSSPRFPSIHCIVPVRAFALNDLDDPSHPALNGWVSIVPIVPIEHHLWLSGVADSDTPRLFRIHIPVSTWDSSHGTVRRGCTGLAQHFLTC